MPKAIILRLESYLSYLAELKALGKTTATSQELANLFGISSSRVRQDMVGLGIVGRPHSGYNIVDLQALIREALDLNARKRMALIGFGNLGRALALSDIWTHGGFDLKAIFDVDTKIIGTDVNGVKVRSMTELFGVIKSEAIEAACITVPAPAAQQVVDMLATAGIKGIWNFSPIELNVPSSITVENQRLEQGLMTLSFKLKEAS
jgi:redox-sensing transcriptional repressor